MYIVQKRLSPARYNGVGRGNSPLIFMKVNVISNPITPYGNFTRGQILDSKNFPESFLHHLVEAGAAEYIKVDSPEEYKKKPSSSLQAGRVSRQKMSKKSGKNESL